MTDRTQHCTGCKERQDRIEELEALLADRERQSENDMKRTAALGEK